MKQFDVAIIGGGAAGLAAAVKCKGSVAVFEARDRVGKKILASGNGRCNFSNLNVSPDKYNDGRFVEKIIQKYPTQKIVEFFDSIGLLSKTEGDRLYPYSETAASVLDTLRRAATKCGVQIFTDFLVTKLQAKDSGFLISGGDTQIFAKKVLVATGSEALFGFPSYNLLLDFGHKLKATTAALSPMVAQNAAIKGLNGIRVKAAASLIVDERVVASENGEILFKDFGLSGIAIFNLSSAYARLGSPKNAVVRINFMPEFSKEQLLQLFRQRLKSNSDAEGFFVGVLRKNVAINILQAAGVKSSVTEADLHRLVKITQNYDVIITKNADMSLAQVACGGYVTEQFDSDTMQSKLVSGLYAAGEALDVDGVCGGFNLHFAWASGLAAADAINKDRR